MLLSLDFPRDGEVLEPAGIEAHAGVTTLEISVEDSTGLGVRFHPMPARAWEKFLEGLVGGKS
jgi:hypothetical protein